MSFMKQALNLAIRARSHNDVPIGAVIVKDGKIISRGENQVQQKNNPILHAEIVAINKACKNLGQSFWTIAIYISVLNLAQCVQPQFHLPEFAKYILQPQT